MASIMLRLAAGVSLIGAGGCATIIEGTSQMITFETSPPEAVCSITREGVELATSTPENRVIKFDKSWKDMVISCSAPGHETKQVAIVGSLSNMTVMSFFLVDFGIVDAISGAARKYPEKITVILPKVAVPPKPTTVSRLR